MEALRKQLGETEGHLQDRDKKYRELNATFKASTREWADRVVELEAAVKALHADNAALEARNGALESRLVELEQTRTPQQNGQQQLLTPPPGGMIITPENKRAMEAKYQKVKDRLADAESRAEELERQLLLQQRLQKREGSSPAEQAQHEDEKDQPDRTGQTTNGEGKADVKVGEQSGSPGAGPDGDMAVKALPKNAVTREDVRHHFNQIRQCIRQLSIEFFSDPLDPKALTEIPAEHATILEKLTPNWKSFLTDDGGFTSYIFRALIWRYLDEFLFKKPESVWGADIPQALALIGAKIKTASSGLVAINREGKDERRRWHAQTLDLLHGDRKLRNFDDAVLTHLTQTITTSIEWYISDSKPRGRVSSQIIETVRQSAELAALIARSQYGVMMGPKPGSELIHGFEPDWTCMSLRHQLRGKAADEGGVVDLMVTPSLIVQDDGAGVGDYIVLEKAEITM